jgi:hypothetical protein
MWGMTCIVGWYRYGDDLLCGVTLSLAPTMALFGVSVVSGVDFVLEFLYTFCGCFG